MRALHVSSRPLIFPLRVALKLLADVEAAAYALAVLLCAISQTLEKYVKTLSLIFISFINLEKVLKLKS